MALGIIIFTYIFYICKNKNIANFYNPFGIIIFAASSPFGIFVSAFALKHLLTVTKGLTSKQLHSIKIFENAIIKSDIKINGFGIVQDQIKTIEKSNNLFNQLKENPDSNHMRDFYSNSLEINQRKFYRSISIKNRLINLYSFYRKTVPSSII